MSLARARIFISSISFNNHRPNYPWAHTGEAPDWIEQLIDEISQLLFFLFLSPFVSPTPRSVYTTVPQ